MIVDRPRAASWPCDADPLADPLDNGVAASDSPAILRLKMLEMKIRIAGPLPDAARRSGEDLIGALKRAIAEKPAISFADVVAKLKTCDELAEIIRAVSPLSARKAISSRSPALFIRTASPPRSFGARVISRSRRGAAASGGAPAFSAATAGFWTAGAALSDSFSAWKAASPGSAKPKEVGGCGLGLAAGASGTAASVVSARASGAEILPERAASSAARSLAAIWLRPGRKVGPPGCSQVCCATT
ncbi:hypothetical protein [uncultured Rhodoblastus sp.]|uniref:hypothetical protein n=1 Tax=uncultured Rhodoblastus sp. TaxID=543037 RepID=UPI0025D910E2|nr:hypothetical protein [uncultured Rhodoblastus sp.]